MFILGFVAGFGLGVLSIILLLRWHYSQPSGVKKWEDAPHNPRDVYGEDADK